MRHDPTIIDSYLITVANGRYRSVVTCTCGMVESGTEDNPYGARDIAEQRLRQKHSWYPDHYTN